MSGLTYGDLLDHSVNTLMRLNQELEIEYAQSQARFRALLDRMLEIADAKNNRNPVDQGIRHTLLNLVENATNEH